ncbi:MAG: hypothetical protein K1X28_04325 [Parachlamydiales bacterium]|nr:hypothetical protein [Parachlamydiales bacterium]
MASPATFTLHKRDLQRAIENQDASKILFQLARNAFGVAAEVAHGKCPRTSEIIFHVSSDFLRKMLPVSTIEAAQLHGIEQLTPDLVHKVSEFVSQYHGYAIRRPKENKNFMELATHMQNGFREFSGRFQKRDLEKHRQRLSCYDFAITEAGFDIRELTYYVERSKDFSANRRIRFLQSKGYQNALMPLKQGDILFFMSEENELLHAGLVNADGNLSSKPGNENPYFYIHSLEDTPIMYGTQYTILRKP